MIIPWPVGKADGDAYISSQNIDYIKGLCKLQILYLSHMLNFTHSDQTAFSFAQFLMFHAFFLKLLLLPSIKKGGIFAVRFDP